jgi:predicted glycosyltransferase involved in capsule biosynthesis
MGRLHHLKQTYLKNIELALGQHDNCEFVLLNWNSQDGLDEWVRQNLSEYIDKGIVKYLHTEKPEKFHQSLTKNITCKNATGSIVCVVDADNFFNRRFIPTVLEKFKKEEFPLLHGAGANVAGRMACFKKHFVKIRGFDEKMTGWGAEDWDFTERFKAFFPHTIALKVGSYFLGPGIPSSSTEFNRQKANRARSKENLKNKIYIPNGPTWGILP